MATLKIYTDLRIQWRIVHESLKFKFTPVGPLEFINFSFKLTGVIIFFQNFTNLGQALRRRCPLLNTPLSVLIA